MGDPGYVGESIQLAVSGCRVGISLPGGDRLPALVCQPALVPAPAVLIVHDASGPTRFYATLARRVAAAGFVALLPDLYFRVDPDVERGPAGAARLDYQQTIQALDTAVDWLRAQPYVAGQRLGTVGFSLGGTLVLDLAAERRDIATATFYGFPSGHLRGAATAPLALADRIQGPIIGFFGAQDEVVPLAEVQRLEDALRRSGVEVTFTIYPDVGHSFVAGSELDPNRPTRFAADYARASGAWSATLAFFHRQLNRGTDAQRSERCDAILDRRRAAEHEDTR
jgi:carboxymethylenebutenolidase